MATADKKSSDNYLIRPNFQKKFRPKVVKEVIKQVLHEKLDGVTYHSENTPQWTREIADEIKARLKRLDRYKFVVQVLIGEQRGEGIRCFWDSDTDNYASEIFSNDSLFCVGSAFGVYYY